MTHAKSNRGSSKAVPTAIIILIVFYAISILAGLPQHGTKQILAAGHNEAAAGHEVELVAPPVWTVIPFAFLLLGIAVLPLIPFTEHWWESNLSRFLVAIGLAAVTL